MGEYYYRGPGPPQFKEQNEKSVENRKGTIQKLSRKPQNGTKMN